MVEEPCSKTGGPCEWVCEEEYDEHGEMKAWDNYCCKCNRWRDWSKEQMEDASDDVCPI